VWLGVGAGVLVGIKVEVGAGAVGIEVEVGTGESGVHPVASKIAQRIRINDLGFMGTSPMDNLIHGRMSRHHQILVISVSPKTGEAEDDDCVSLSISMGL
jgi:hypothetical protein